MNVRGLAYCVLLHWLVLVIEMASNPIEVELIIPVANDVFYCWQGAQQKLIAAVVFVCLCLELTG